MTAITEGTTAATATATATSGGNDYTSPPQLCIYLHSELSFSQASHGISHEDYAQYAAYCTRRLSRLRHNKLVKKDLLHCRMYKSSLSTVTTVDSSEAAGSSGSSKARHAYRAIDITNLPSDVLASHVNYFLEPLYCAERCWAASMAVKTGVGGVGGVSISRKNGVK